MAVALPQLRSPFARAVVPVLAGIVAIGLIGAAELHHPAHSDTPGSLGAAANAIFHENGLISRAMLDAMAFCPPLIITKAEVDEMLKRTKVGVDTAYEALKSEGLLNS